MINFGFNGSEETLTLLAQMPSRRPGLALDTMCPLVFIRLSNALIWFRVLLGKTCSNSALVTPREPQSLMCWRTSC